MYLTHNIGNASAFPIILDWARFDHLSWVLDHSSRGSCHVKEGEQSRRANIFWQWKVHVNSLQISAPQSASALSVKGKTGSVKGEIKSANFWQEKV